MRTVHVTYMSRICSVLCAIYVSYMPYMHAYMKCANFIHITYIAYMYHICKHICHI